MQNQHAANVIIVGAGLAGLMAARVLQKEGFSPVILEKEDRIGGRLATRTLGPGQADYGAQFFTARTPEFEVWIQRWLREDLIFKWSTGWSDGSLHRAPEDGHPRYAVRGGMQQLAAYLAQDLSIQTGTAVAQVVQQGAFWKLTDSQGEDYTANALLLTPPVPQALGLLHDSNAWIALDDLALLSSLTYAPCLSGMFWLDGPLYLPAVGAIQRPEMPIQWIADNERKGISDACVVTVQAGPQFSRARWDVPGAAVLDEMMAAFTLFMAPNTTLREARLKRWRHSLPEKIFSQRCLFVDGAAVLGFAGDAFGGPRIEGAVLSGLAAGARIAEQLKAAAG